MSGQLRIELVHLCLVGARALRPAPQDVKEANRQVAYFQLPPAASFDFTMLYAQAGPSDDPHLFSTSSTSWSHVLFFSLFSVALVQAAVVYQDPSNGEVYTGRPATATSRFWQRTRRHLVRQP